MRATVLCVRAISSIPKADLYHVTRDRRHACCLLLLRENSRESDDSLTNQRMSERERKGEKERKEKKQHIRTQGTMKYTRVAYHARGSTRISRHEPRFRSRPCAFDQFAANSQPLK